MKNNFGFLAALFFVASCNNADKKDPEKRMVSDTIATKATATEIVENEDYTKRNINVSLAELAKLKVSSHLIDKGAVGNKDAVTGDFNGDGKKETLYLIAPTTDTTDGAFEKCYGGPCNSYVVSSDALMPVLKVADNLGEAIKVIGDMDGDGGEELIVYPSWWQSNWNPYRIYSFNKGTNKWSFLVEPVSIFANVLYNGRDILVKKSKKKGFVMAYTSKSNDKGVISAYKEFKIIK